MHPKHTARQEMQRKKRGDASQPASGKVRINRFRQRQREAGAKQITTYLTVEASALLEQMTAFSGESQGSLISEALCELAFNYGRWGLDDPSDEGLLPDWLEDLEGDTSHVEDHKGRWIENPHYRGDRPVPPWIIEDERRSRAELAAERRQAEESHEWREVYQRGLRYR
jgi:hypothetical protein